MIRLTVPDIDDADVAAVEEVLRSGFLVQGERVARFETAVAAYVGSRYAVAVSNCTAALYISLVAAGVGRGDVVALSAYSWPATANVVELCGATPLFIDVDPDTFNMSIDALELALKADRVAAVLVVHAFGGPADSPVISEIASSFDVPVIEDAACALGTRIEGRHVGTWGVTGCFSFHPRKTITTGEGGVIVTDDPRTADLCRALRNHGQDPNASRSDFIVPAFNFRMTEMQAALGEVQMRKLEERLADRREKAIYYNDLLQGTGVSTPVTMSGGLHSYQSYVVLLPPDVAQPRDGIIEKMRLGGIETTIGTYNIPATAFYSARYGYSNDDYPLTSKVAKRSLTLPLHHEMSKSEQEAVVQSLLISMS